MTDKVGHTIKARPDVHLYLGTREPINIGARAIPLADLLGDSNNEPAGPVLFGARGHF
ncbi:MAG TPA: hypothetical protein VGF80_05245 [Galbitalea sp.]